MQTKDFTITLDMVRTLPFRPFEVVEGDTGNVLHVTLLNNGDAMDLSSCLLCIAFASSAGFAMQDETSGVTKTNGVGTFDVALLPTAYGAGNVSADVQVYSGANGETLVTSARFDFRCRKSLISGEIIRANAAYPPLVEATRTANEAAAAALAAAARIDTDVGELNVQADWNEADASNDAYIKNKPTSFAPSAHKASHAAGGADAVTPADIGASSSDHTHTPSALGAAALDAGGKVTPEQASAGIVQITEATALALSHAGKLLSANSASALTVTIPLNATAAFPVGTEIELCQYGVGAVTVAATEGVTLLSMDASVSAAGQYACMTLKKLDTDTWLLAGALA